MRALFAFDAGAWEILEARHAVATLASLLEVPARLGDPGATATSDELLVHVGRPDTAPAGAAAVIEVAGWPKWSARSLVATSVAGVSLPCPPMTMASGGDQVFPAAWLRATAWLLAREEEYEDDRRDQWECYSGAFTRLSEIGLLDQPMINRQARALEVALERHAATRGGRLEHEPRWPNGARFAVALSHDVDDVTLRSWRMSWRLLRQARSPDSYAMRAGLTGAARALARRPGERDPYWTFERWMSEEERHGFRSTFYFCPPAPSRRHEYDPLYRMDDTIGFLGRRIAVAELLREMERCGHEIGLHGSYSSHRDAEELGRQRAQIAAAAPATGAPMGIRQHFLRFDIRSTWAAQAAAGFGYDTTLGYNEALGFRAGIAAPFVPWDVVGRKPHRLLEVPLTAMDGTLFRTLRLDAGAASDLVRRHLEEVEAVGGLAVLLWHPNAADERLFPGWWECYERTLTWLAGRPAWVAPVGTISRWWAARVGGTPGAPFA